MRLDQYLTQEGFFTSRNKAQSEIKNGNVKVDGKLILKPNFDYIEGKIEIVDQMPYVGRGGLKLEEAISKFNLDFENKIILDIGSSTGGFTDCSLKHGALKVYAVDVGKDQLDLKLRENPKVLSFEETNINSFIVDEHFDFLVMDVSFVSISHVLEGIKRYIDDTNSLICLIKPQFEAGKMVNKGIIKDKKTHLNILKSVNLYLNEAGLYINMLIPSPIKGGSGNIEFLALITKQNKSQIDFTKVVEEAHRKN